MRKHRQIGPYALLQRLGHHDEDQTSRWLAHKPGDRSYSHLKLFEGAPLWFNRARHWSQAAREAQALRAAPHPNLPRIHHFGHQEDKGEAWLAMEYLHGRSLAQRLLVDDHGESEPLPWRAAVEIARQLCDAVEHAHNLIDPDTSGPLRPRDLQLGLEQIMITHTGTVKLLGIGALRQWRRDWKDAPKRWLTYSAPEHLRASTDCLASDTFSIGSILFHAVTGEPPFGYFHRHRGSQVDFEVYERLRLAALRQRPRVLNRGLPQALEDILIKALCPAPSGRYRTPHLLGEALEDLLAEVRPIGGLQQTMESLRAHIYDGERDAILGHLIESHNEEMVGDYIWQHLGPSLIEPLRLEGAVDWTTFELLRHLPQAYEPLAHLASDKNAMDAARAAAATILGERSDDLAAECLDALIHPDNPTVSRAAQHALDRLGDPRHPPPQMISALGDRLQLAAFDNRSGQHPFADLVLDAGAQITIGSQPHSDVFYKDLGEYSARLTNLGDGILRLTQKTGTQKFGSIDFHADDERFAYLGKFYLSAEPGHGWIRLELQPGFTAPETSPWVTRDTDPAIRIDLLPEIMDITEELYFYDEEDDEDYIDDVFWNPAEFFLHPPTMAPTPPEPPPVEEMPAEITHPAALLLPEPSLWVLLWGYIALRVRRLLGLTSRRGHRL